MKLNQPPRLSPELMTEIARRGERRTFQADELLFNEGDKAQTLFVLHEGQLKVFSRGSSGREFVYNVLHQGEIFGELFLDDGPRSASVMAITNSTCIEIDRGGLMALLKDYPELTMMLFRKLSARLRNATNLIRSLAFDDVYSRTVRLLESVAVDEECVRRVPPNMTQQEIASRIGASREMVNIVIRELTRGGYLKKDTKRGLTIIESIPPRW